MADEYVHERVAETDPRRCQGIVQNGSKAGQCEYKAVENSLYCMMHGGNKAVESNKKNGLKNYRIQQWGERIGELANNPNIKSLTEEIGVLRMLLEETLNKCKTVNDLLIYSDKISSMTEKIQRLVEACHKMEEKSGNLLDRKVIIVIADSIVSIVSEYVTDPDAMLEISQKLCKSIEAAASPELAHAVQP